MSSTTWVNTIETASGRLRPVCEHCGKIGRSIAPNSRGVISCFDLALGWSIAPYPADYLQRDGSLGSTFTCSTCNRTIRDGQWHTGIRGRAQRQIG